MVNMVTKHETGKSKDVRESSHVIFIMNVQFVNMVSVKYFETMLPKKRRKYSR